MPKSIIVEGKTTSDAIERGLKELNATKNMVEINVLEEEKKRSFYSILAPRVVKIEMTLKEGAEVKEDRPAFVKPKKQTNKNMEEIKEVSKKIEEFFRTILDKDVSCDVNIQDFCIYVKINGENINHLIGYRGTTINALQTLATAISNKYSQTKITVIVDVGDYKEKRKKTLEDLAEKVSRKSY